MLYYVAGRPDLMEQALGDQAQRLHRLLLNLLFKVHDSFSPAGPNITYSHDTAALQFAVQTSASAQSMEMDTAAEGERPSVPAMQTICSNILAYCAELMSPVPGAQRACLEQQQTRVFSSHVPTRPSASGESLPLLTPALGSAMPDAFHLVEGTYRKATLLGLDAQARSCSLGDSKTPCSHEQTAAAE